MSVNLNETHASGNTQLSLRQLLEKLNITSEPSQSQTIQAQGQLTAMSQASSSAVRTGSTVMFFRSPAPASASDSLPSRSEQPSAKRRTRQ